MAGASTGGAGGKVASVMQEDRVFPPPAAFSARARIGSLEEYRRLYAAAAAELAAMFKANFEEKGFASLGIPPVM